MDATSRADRKTSHTCSPFADSEYYVVMNPGGQFDYLGQEIEWFSTANQASFTSDFNAAYFGRAPSVNLSGVGDGARGALVNGSSGGYAQIVFSAGQLSEFVFFASENGIQASDVQKLAQTVAHYIDAAGLGS